MVERSAVWHIVASQTPVYAIARERIAQQTLCVYTVLASFAMKCGARLLWKVVRSTLVNSTKIIQSLCQWALNREKTSQEHSIKRKNYFARYLYVQRCIPDPTPVCGIRVCSAKFINSLVWQEQPWLIGRLCAIFPRNYECQRHLIVWNLMWGRNWHSPHQLQRQRFGLKMSLAAQIEIQCCVSSRRAKLNVNSNDLFGFLSRFVWKIFRTLEVLSLCKKSSP